MEMWMAAWTQRQKANRHAPIASFCARVIIDAGEVSSNFIFRMEICTFLAMVVDVMWRRLCSAKKKLPPNIRLDHVVSRQTGAFSARNGRMYGRYMDMLAAEELATGRSGHAHIHTFFSFAYMRNKQK